MSFTDTLTDVYYGNSTFVAVGVSGTILTSTDGTSWDNRSSGTSISLGGVTFGNNKFFVMPALIITKNRHSWIPLC